MMRFIVCSLLVGLGAIGCSDPTSPDRHVELRIDADVYHVGDGVQVTLVNRHAINSDLIWHFPCQVNVELQDGDGWELVGTVGDTSCILFLKRLQPGHSHDWSFTIDRYHALGRDGEATYEPGGTYRFVTGIRNRSRDDGALIYSRPFVVQH